MDSSSRTPAAPAGSVRPPPYAAGVPDLEPPELAALVDVAERPRAGDWSLRAALVRYAQFRPGLVRDLMEVVRRLELVTHTHGRLMAREGPAIWAALEGGTTPPGDLGLVVEVLRVARDLDHLAETVAAWAQHRAGDLPDEAVATVTRAAAQRLDELGVPREEQTRPRRRG